MHAPAFCLYLAFMAPAYACARDSAGGAAVNATAAASLTSQSFYNVLASLPQAEQAAKLAVIGRLNLATWESRLGRLAASPLTIDGHVVRFAAQQFTVTLPASVDHSSLSVAEAWSKAGLALDTVTLTQFTTALHQQSWNIASPATAALALDDDDDSYPDGAYVRLQPPGQTPVRGEYLPDPVFQGIVGQAADAYASGGVPAGQIGTTPGTPNRMNDPYYWWGAYLKYDFSDPSKIRCNLVDTLHSSPTVGGIARKCTPGEQSTVAYALQTGKQRAIQASGPSPRDAVWQRIALSAAINSDATD